MIPMEHTHSPFFSPRRPGEFIFDSLLMAQRLEEQVGFTRQQSQGFTAIFRDMLESNLVTRQDLSQESLLLRQDFEREMTALRRDFEVLRRDFEVLRQDFEKHAMSVTHEIEKLRSETALTLKGFEVRMFILVGSAAVTTIGILGTLIRFF